MTDLWIFLLSTITTFLFSFGIGSNDVANSFGTSIGSGALTLRQTALIASVCEISGALTLGAGVSDTILRQISKLEDAACWDCGGQGDTRMRVFMLGMACALMAGAAFMLAATFMAMPVSTTHAIVGAVLGITLVGAGPLCVKWGYPGLLSIVASWFISPAAAGLLSCIFLGAVERWILTARRPLERALVAFPILYGGSVATVLALVLLKAQIAQDWPDWLKAAIVLAIGAATWGLAQVLIIPRLQLSVPLVSGYAASGHAIEPRTQAANSPRHPLPLPSLPIEPALGSSETRSETMKLLDAPDELQAIALGLEDDLHREAHGAGVCQADSGPSPSAISLPNPPAEQVFRHLQVLTACLKSFAHGANDTANAAGPYAAVQALYLHGFGDCKHVQTPFWVLAYCACGLVVGLATCGHLVMQTVGKDLTSLNYSRGFAVDLGSTLSVVVASAAGMPISSTHCQIGSVVAVGLLEGGLGSVQWGVFSKIVMSWLVTVPAAALAAGLLLAALRFSLP